MLWKLLREGLSGTKPTHVAVVFDYSEKTFRNEIYPDYKGHRPDPPSELIPQFPLMREAVKAFGLVPIEQKRYEADDIIATYSRLALERGADVTIVAGDKDLMQLVRPGINMYDPMPGNERRIGPEEVKEKFGVPPEKVPEVQALVGDTTDNVPGVPGIGVKTAAQLINDYGDLETLLARASEIKQEKRRQSLIDFAEQARISRRLVVLDDQVDLAYPLELLCLDGADCLKGGDARTLIAFLKAMEFTSLIKRVSEATGIDASEIAADPRLAPGTVGLSPASEVQVEERAMPAAQPTTAALAVVQTAAVVAPRALVVVSTAEITQPEIDRLGYATIAKTEDLDTLVAIINERGRVAIDLVTTSADPMIAEIVGISLAVGVGEAFYVPLGHHGSSDLLAGSGRMRSLS
jgi:DNA polymerase-1